MRRSGRRFGKGSKNVGLEDRKKDDGGDDVFDVLPDPREGDAEVIPEQRHAHDPPDPAGYIKKDEPAVVHSRDPRHDGSERPREGNKPGHDDGHAAVLLIEIPRPDEVFLPEPPRVRPAVERVSRLRADPVSDRIAGDRRDAEKNDQQVEVEGHRAVGYEKPRRDEQRIAGQEKPDE